MIMNSLFPLGDDQFGHLGPLRDSYGQFQISDLPDANAGTEVTDDQQSYVGLALSEGRLRTVYSVVFSVLLILVLRSFFLQVVSGAHYASEADDNRFRIEPIQSDRGVIYDRNHVALARNTPDFTAALRPASLPETTAERNELFARLSDILQMNPVDIENIISEFNPKRASHVILKEGLNHEQSVLMEIESASNPAVFLTSGIRREYPYSTEVMSLSHLLGYVGRVNQTELDENSDYLLTDAIGKDGLERSYEDEVRGRYGRRRVEVDATGRFQKVIASDDGEAGLDLILSLDLSLQRDVEILLKEGIKRSKADRGSVIVMNPGNGEILSMVSWPSYDNNVFSNGISVDEYNTLLSDENTPLFQRAIAANLASGSTFKIVTAAAALSEGLITSTTSVISSGGVRVGRWLFPDWKGGGHGITNVTKALAESVNTFFYVIGGGHESHPGIQPLGINLIVEYARIFGLGSPSGVDLPGEGAGFVPTPDWKRETTGEPWYIGDTYHVSIGQGSLTVTPLQVARYTAAIANGGYLVTPHLVKELEDENGTRTIPDVPKPQKIDVSEDAIQTVKRGLRQTVTSGSARSLLTLAWEVAGKTGTAQWHSQKSNHAWFTSFGPYENPEIVVTVIVEEGGEGSSAATPIAKAIYQRYISGSLHEVQSSASSVPAVESEAVTDVIETSEDDPSPAPEVLPVEIPLPQPEDTRKAFPFFLWKN